MGKVVLAIKILDFDLEGSHFIIEADISLRQKADDNMESHSPRCFFENTQVYKETDGVISYCFHLVWLPNNCQSCTGRCS